MGQDIEFTIVIPTHNRPAALHQCLEALGGLDDPGAGFEVIVVDDGSPTGLDAVVDPYRDRLNLTLRVQANAGPGAARNLGASLAKGEYLAFTDDDCAPKADWLAALKRHFASRPDAMIGGETINALTGNLCSEASQLLVSYLYTHYNASDGGPQFFTSNNFAMSRRLFEEVGGFNADFERAAGEDREFCDRWRHLGHPMVYAPEAQVLHFHAMSVGQFWRQHLNYGRGAYRFHKMRAARKREPIRVEPMSFYFKLLVHPLFNSAFYRAPFLALLIVLSQVANTAGFFLEKRQNR
jgi:GT2 family glycosyltransferase